MSQSAATGRNPLLRACNACLATDRWLTRSTNKPKNNRAETEDEKNRRASALKVKEYLKKKTPEEKAAWYADQKATRAQEDQCKKRTFSSAVGSVEDVREKGSMEDDVQRYITFKQWAATEMLLKTYNTLAEAKVAWEKKCKDANTKTMVRNGETLMHEFGGVELRARNAHTLRAGLRQRMDIGNQEDLEEYQEETENRMKRARQRLDIETAARFESGGAADSEKTVPLLTVSKDLGQLRELEETRDQELHAQALQIQESRKADAEQRKQEQANQPRSLPLEKLSYEAARKKAVQSMSDVLLRLLSSLKTQETELAKTLEAESADLKSEKDGRVEVIEGLLQTVEQTIAEKETAWQDLQESSTAEELAQARDQVATYMKSFHTKEETVLAVKNKIADLRNWHTKTKKSINEREKAAQKTAASKKMAASSGSTGLELLSSSLVGLSSLSNCGNVDYSFHVANVLKKRSPTVFETARGQSLLSTVAAMEYYRLQKTWVQEKMKSSQSNSCAAMVSKKPVQKKLSEILQRSWAECYGSSEETAFLAGMPDEMRDYFIVQFGQRLAGTAGIAMRTDLNLPTLMVVLEGTLLVGGIRSSDVRGNTLAEEIKKMEAMKAKDVSSLVSNKGWFVKLEPGSSLVIPGDTIYFEIAGGEADAHCLRQILGRENFLPFLKEYLTALDSAGSLQDGDRLKKMLTYLRNMGPGN